MTTRKQLTNGVKRGRPTRLISTYWELDEILPLPHVKSISFVYYKEEDATACYLRRSRYTAWVGRVKGIDASAALSQALEKLDKEVKDDKVS